MKKKKYFNIVMAAILLVIMIKFRIVVISGQSMEPMLMDSQIIILYRTKNVKINDIIVFTKDNTTYVKRVIATEGSKIEMKQGNLYVNGKLSSFPCDGDAVQHFIMKNELFVIGDNYYNSIDSRCYGPIVKSNIVGKVLFTIA